MAIIKAISSKASIGTALDYVTKEEKTDKKLVSGIRCYADTVKDEMQATKIMWGKTGGRTYKHFVLSYHENENIASNQAHKNALELARGTKAWEDFEVLVATHTDKGHIHTHFIVNSVSMDDGHKLQWSKSDLQDLKKRCNEQCREQGLHIAQKGKTFEGKDREETTAYSKDTYQLLKKAEQCEVQSYVFNIALKLMECKEKAKSKQEFIDMMEEKGVGVEWQDNRKYITFTDLEREQNRETKCKVRNNKLSQYYNMDFGKESLEDEFEINLREQERADRNERARAEFGTYRGTEQAHQEVAIEELRARERVAEQERYNSELERADREVERERLNSEREREVKSREQVFGTKVQDFGAREREDESYYQFHSRGR